ncbi:LPXTG-motif cell wall anchor domain-containing protein [Pseudobutyrivibrio sp. UC1225]|uniref:SpaA isopeptide-forming pilin-related protein n=1 Tax=Pseudobutyrivibrio sp. UC1225 TaxID=1798185 RepID=UPI0008EA0FFB|nr:SpaA isopeptide-forming pilin-related protein [Pseudobutyrivibrio sp. UC1225]SFN86318.1 LPXTG-motif cell wall anchor domain-containing protein [Pseudobutyrivibrio sp. UC1225]
MKNFKKVIAFALAAIMMMAMSITAFAEQSTGSATIKVTNISERDEKTELSVYQLASIDTAKNKIEVVDWAKAVYPKKDDNNQLIIDVDALNAAFEAANPTAVKKAESVNGADVEFTDLAAGVYMIKVVGKKVQYNTMVAVAYTTDDNGNYVATTKAVEIKAKGSSNNMEKKDDDGLVRAGQKVNFELKSTVPYMANKTNVEYKIYDRETNLSAPEDVKVFVGGKEMAFNFGEGVAKDGYTEYTMDLTSLVESGMNDQYAGKTVVVKYTATVIGSNGFTNVTYDSTYDKDENGEPKNPPTVKGWPADITLIKYAEDGKTILNGAEFEVSKNGTVLYFAQESEGVYNLVDEKADGATKTIVAPKGKVQIKGLDEGTYLFTETKAPEGYSINPAGAKVTITDLSEDLTNKNTITEAQKALLSQEGSINDTKLSSLPFTGGMGTTIFTVLGVALMALASALYFATKKKASVN